jgi:hypothetical protein
MARLDGGAKRARIGKTLPYLRGRVSACLVEPPCKTVHVEGGLREPKRRLARLDTMSHRQQAARSRGPRPARLWQNLLGGFYPMMVTPHRASGAPAQQRHLRSSVSRKFPV